MTEPSPRERLRRLAARLGEMSEKHGSPHLTPGDFDAIVAELRRLQIELFGRRPRSGRGQGARARILAHLRSHLGQPVHGEELAAVSGIQEWARRLRELRVEDGYDITELGASTYRLERSEPDVARAAAWKLANEIRKRPGSARGRIEAFLSASEGTVVTRDHIDYVARIAEGSRRVRELRDEFGWPIDSHIDEPGLEPGQYRLLSTNPSDRRDPAQRLYPEELRRRVFERDNYTCQECGRDRERALRAGDTRFYLEVHHRVAVADEVAKLGPEQLNDMSNLITLCHSDHRRATEQLQRLKRERRRNTRSTP